MFLPKLSQAANLQQIPEINWKKCDLALPVATQHWLQLMSF
jgi:hypothetical protein